MSQANAKRTSLMTGCGSAALALGLLLGTASAQAQGIQANGTVTFGGANIDQTVPNQTTVEVFSPTTVIDWQPIEDAAGNALDFLPTNANAFYQNNPNASINGRFAVLNRILPSTNGNVAVINGNVISQIFDANLGSSIGGFIAFYSPTGILVGSTASFDVGQLLLTTLDTTPDNFDQFAQSGSFLQLQGAQGSTARIQINPGAQILATPENAFFAVVAADVEMRGIARVNGSHAYIAGEAVNLSFDNGLFSIQVPVGTAAAGEVVTLDGTVGGPSSTGLNGDNHLIYAVARASQDPISMLLRGNLGFDPAQSAGVVNGEIIISANYNVAGRSVDGGSIDDGINARFGNNSELSTTRADIFLEDFAASSSLLAIGTHRTQVTARTRASSVLGNLLMVGRQNAELTASNGQNFTISGDVLVSAQDYGVSGSGLQSLSVINATAGIAFIDAFGGGTMTISGSALVAADAFAGAETISGLAGSATAGQALIGSTGGTLRILGDATVTARGVGSSSSSIQTGATSRGGLAQFFSVQGGNVTLNGALELDASATGAGSSFGTNTASNAFGGNAFLNVFNGAGLITIGNGATVRANATGGDANAASGAGIGDAGVAIANVNSTGTIDITGNLTLEASGSGGNNGDGTGGEGLGGRASSFIDAGGQIFVRGDFSADASGRGGDGANGGDGLGGIAGGIANIGVLSITGSGFANASGQGGSATFGFGGNGGIGRGGNAAFQASGTLTQTARIAIDGDATLLADGAGGDGGLAFDQTNTLAGRGGDAFGGAFGVPNQADPAFGSGAFLLAGGDNGSIAVGGSAFVSAGATGGRGGSGDFLLGGGEGGNAVGGLAQVGLALLGQNGSVGLGLADFGTVIVNANALGGGGGLTSVIETGNGGTGTGGLAAVSVRAGDVIADDLILSATGVGGNGAIGGIGSGGSATMLGSLGGTLISTGVTLEANGFGGVSNLGTGGDGIGGVAELEVDGTTMMINGDLLIDASGVGGDSADGAGGNGLGGEAYIGQVGVGVGGPGPGTLNVTGHTEVFANGRGGNSVTDFAAGNGQGGHAWIRSSAGATKTFGSVQLTAIGTGGLAAIHEGGNGTGGLVELIATGTGSRITIARNVPAPFSPIGSFSSAMLDASGFGESTFGGDGIGGVGQGGTVMVNAETGGAINLPVEILSDPARAADQLQFFAQGLGGDSSVDGGAGGQGSGGSVTLLVSGGTLLAGPTTISTYAQGGTSLNQGHNITGGDAFGGSRTIRVLANGNLTIETSDVTVPVAAQGGNGSGTGNGGSASSGSVQFEVINSVATLQGAFNLYNRAAGGIGRIGGNAIGGTISVNARNATINAVAGVGGKGTIEIGGENAGGTGLEAGGDAFGGSVNVTLASSQLNTQSLTINQSATGGPVSAADAIGGEGTAGTVSLTASNSTLIITDRLDLIAIGSGGASGINAVGGAGIGGEASLMLTETALTVGAAAQGAPGVIAIRADGEGGQGGTVGIGAGGTALLEASNGTITTGTLLVSAQGRSVGGIGQIGGAADGGIAKISLDDVVDGGGNGSLSPPALILVGGEGGVTPFGPNGPGRIDATTIIIDSSAATASGGTAIGGISTFDVEGASTVVVNATDLVVNADATGADPVALANRAGSFGVSVTGGSINLVNLNATARGDRVGLDPVPSLIAAFGGNINVTNHLTATAFDNLQVSQASGGIIGSAGTGQTGTIVELDTRGTLTIAGDGGSTGGLGGRVVLGNAGRSILINGTINATSGVTLVANTGGGQPLAQPGPSMITMDAGSRINAGTGAVSIIIIFEDGSSDPQRQTGAITLANITAGSISARNFGMIAGSDVNVLAGGVLTASGTGRAIDLAALGGEVINLHGDAGLILTGGGHFGIFTATPTGSQIGSPGNFVRRYNVLTAGAYDALNPGGNFAAFRITPVLTVTADDIARFYGSANPAFTATIAGFLPGDSIADITGAAQFSTLADGASPIGQYAINAALGTLLSTQGYQFSFAPGILTVTPRQITITANSLSRIYGNANPALTFVVGGQGLVNGDQLGGALATAADLTSGVGTYGITQGTLFANSNYALTFVGGQLTVTPRPITITANSFSRIYGNANPALTFVVGGQGLVNNDQLTGALTTIAGVTTGIGTYAITQGTLSAGANYAVTYNAGNIDITPRPITITADSFSRIYGNLNPALTFGIGGLGLVNGDQITGALTTVAGVTTGIGNYAITQGTLTAGANYAVTFNAGVLGITARPITITASDLSRIYGNANPALTFAVGGDGLVNGDQLSGSLATTAGMTSGIGNYAITQGTLAASANYILTFNAGNLSITPRPITITANSLSRIYGNANPALTFAVGGQGLVNGDQLGGALATTAGLTSGVGTYGITQGTLIASNNYAVSFVGGQLTVTPRPITIDANSFSRIYGNANPALTFAVGGQGLVNGDQLTGALATTAGVTTGVGTFAINQGTLSAGANYTVTYNAGALTITPRPITITADSFARVYGNANPALTFGVGGQGLVNGDQLTGALAAAGVTAGVGTSAITQGTLTAGANYAVTFNAGILTITPRPITITANNFSRVYGNANPALTFTVGGQGLVNGDQLSGALATAAGLTTGVGTSAITLGTLTAGGNYTVAFTAGVLTITPRPLTVAANNLSKSLGLADPLLTFSITAGDLVNGDLLSGSLVRDPGEGVASFVIRQGTLSAGSNYALTFVPGTFTINPPPVSPDINNPTTIEPALVSGETPPPVEGEEEERFGIDFPEQPDAPLISEDPLLDDPVASGGDSSLYGSGGPAAPSTTTTGGQ